MYRHRAGGGFINTVRYQSKVEGFTRPYNTIHHTSPIRSDSILYHVRSITHNWQPGHGTINVICLSEISMMPCPYATTL
ncbi:hypothetical protein [Microseira wollei]|uniref:hypothetical protein n=1 Tax=Microseira wollei TaxID=467598 RepID=UPI001CFEC620|nr:hypothetical protein [Microseira wollei]